MRVKVGWNTEFGRDKFDIFLDEDDLHRLLHDNGFDPDVALARLTTPEAFEILKREAQMLAEYAKLDLLAKDSDPWRNTVQKIRTFRDQRDEQLAQLKAKLNGPG